MQSGRVPGMFRALVQQDWFHNGFSQIALGCLYSKTLLLSIFYLHGIKYWSIGAYSLGKIFCMIKL